MKKTLESRRLRSFGTMPTGMIGAPLLGCDSPLPKWQARLLETALTLAWVSRGQEDDRSLLCRVGLDVGQAVNAELFRLRPSVHFRVTTVKLELDCSLISSTIVIPPILALKT